MAAKLHILIITKEKDMGILLSRISKKKDLIPHHAKNEAEATSIIQKVNPFVTFLDFNNMSIENFENLKRLKNIHPDCSIIVFTQIFSPTIRERVLRSGADYCLIKPLDAKELYKCVDNILSRKLFRETNTYNAIDNKKRSVSISSKHFIGREPRIPCRMLVKFRPISPYDKKCDQERVAMTRNISSGGMELETDYLDDNISKLTLRVYSPFDREEWIHSLGWIVWKQQSPKIGSCRVGLQFLGLDERERNTLLHYATRSQLKD